MWRIACSTDATDFEHDRCDFIRLDVAAPTAVLGAHGGEMVYLGTLASALMWPTGTDPLQQSEPDTQAGACDGWPGMAGEHDPHPMAAYVPSRRDEVDAIVPSFVAVTVWPTADGRAHDSEGGSH